MNISTYLTSNASKPLEQSLRLTKSRKSVQSSFYWGSLNVLLLAVLLYDMAHSCPFYYGWYEYARGLAILVVSGNIMYHGAKITVFRLSNEQIVVTAEQKKLLGVSDGDTSFKIVKPCDTPKANRSTYPNTPMNMTALSWMSTSNETSFNYSLSSPSWTFHAAPKKQLPKSPEIPYRDTSGVDFISDESDLKKYLNDFDVNTSVANLSNQTQSPISILSSFWKRPTTGKDITGPLGSFKYQTASKIVSSPQSPQNKSSPKVSQTVDIPWTRLKVDMITLSQWNENLRKWICGTILDRLVREFDRVNDVLEKHGLGDIKIGSIGLDRVRKTAQLSQVTQFVPSFATLIPFLEITPNQAYLEKRIRDLAKGGCMSEFKWNGGGCYNGKDWDVTLPTDAALVMHLFASYLDTQLIPLPNMPDVKTFSGLYLLKAGTKTPPLTAESLYIQETTEKSPHFRIIVGETIYEMAKGYNNLFHSILFFLYQVNKIECGMLGRVYLGRAGINMLWIIGQD